MGRPRITPICTTHWAQGHKYNKDGVCSCGFKRVDAKPPKPSKPVRIERTTLGHLERIAASKGTTLQDVLREALGEYIDRHTPRVD